MTLSRRQVLRIGGGVLAGLAVHHAAAAEDAVEIRMQGNADGSEVWFDPIGVRIAPGQTVRWLNLDPGNSHTTTAYHPRNFDRPQRIPDGAKPWDSDYLLPNETFSVVLSRVGVYDYFCVPHEHAGMVGRIVVGAPEPGDVGPSPRNQGGEPIPEAALKAFPSVEEIMRKGIVRRG